MSPVIILKLVDLPAPFAPHHPRRSPRLTPIVIVSTATIGSALPPPLVDSNTLRRPSITSTSSCPAPRPAAFDRTRCSSADTAGSVPAELSSRCRPPFCLRSAAASSTLAPAPTAGEGAFQHAEYSAPPQARKHQQRPQQQTPHMKKSTQAPIVDSSYCAGAYACT